jgi:DNA-binding beta-propeller fold protein YncE
MVVLLLTGCGGGGGGRLETVFGKHGLQAGQFVRPRAVALDGQGRLFIADFSGRIQVLDREGQYLGGWHTPTILKGRPAGVGIARDGNILVADSHYQRILVYTPQGELLREINGENDPVLGPFAYVADVVQDGDGNYYLTEFGEEDRIRKLGPDGKYLKHWGGHGNAPGQLARPRGLALGADGLLYVADALNHRIQVFDREGNLVRHFGQQGAEPGQLNYPYDVALGPTGDVYVVEFGNHRVQRFGPDGTWKAAWGGPGREPGGLNGPWGLVVDDRGRVFVLDTDNHRIQRVEL